MKTEKASPSGICLRASPAESGKATPATLACDHYHRYKEDVSLMREIGVKAYRLSVSWPRVIPEGKGSINSLGLGFYDRLVDEMLAQDIQPWVTLFHWDYPYQLFLRGGWLNPDSPKWFADYVEAVIDKLSDRVTHWITLNEPQCFLHLGHSVGEHAPGLKLGVHEVLLATHHALLAHGFAVQTIRARAKSEATHRLGAGWVVLLPGIGQTRRYRGESPRDDAGCGWMEQLLVRRPGHFGPLSGGWLAGVRRCRAKVPSIGS